MIAIVDYGVGNLFSIGSSLAYLGTESVVTADPDEIDRASHVILPGVGAFGDAVAKLRASGLDRVVLTQAERGKPLLGICLGMQLLYERSFEYGEHRGLGLIPGDIVPLTHEILGGPLKIPHMGWNALEYREDCPLTAAIPEGSAVYYVHSYYAPVSSHTTALSRYGQAEVTGVVQRGNVFGTQFHPEKSGETGLAILKAFTELGG